MTMGFKIFPKASSALAFFLSVFLSPSGAHPGEIIHGAGATFPYPIYSAWAFEYQKATGARLNYQSVGSGGGQRQISERTVDFGASDDPLPLEFVQKERLLQFPAVIGGVVPAVNIKGVGAGALRLDAEALCGIFLGKIKYWDEKSITSLNPGLRLPHGEIAVVWRSDGSGTTSIFTSYLSDACPGWKSAVGAGKAVKWPKGIGGKGNEGVANYVKRIKNSIGYVEYAYAFQGRLSHALLKNPSGEFVEPGIKSFMEAASGADFDPKRHFSVSLVNRPGKGAWPIAGASFILLAEEKTAVNKEVVRFFDWAFENGDGTAEALHYVPLPGPLKEKIRGYWKAGGLYR